MLYGKVSTHHMTGAKNTKLSEGFETELGQISLPAEIEVIGFLGKGRRSRSYKGKYGNQDIVVKVYYEEFVQKYIRKYNIDIAEFEFERNSTLYDIDAIKSYITKPYRFFPIGGNYTHSFIQEYVDGITLTGLVARLGYLPQEVLKAGYEIVRTAESHGIHDLDISAGNILTVNCNEGEGWIPKLYDFNLLPQHVSPPNPFIAWGIKTGIRSKSHRDYRSLKNWQRMAKNKH